MILTPLDRCRCISNLRLTDSKNFYMGMGMAPTRLLASPWKAWVQWERPLALNLSR